MSYRRTNYRPERRRSGVGCLAWLVAIVWILLLAVLAYRFFLRDQVSQFIGEQVSNRIERQSDSQAAQQLQTSVAAGLPTTIAALPSGEIRISEAQANDYIVTHSKSLGPIESATVHFVPNEVRADIRAVGTTSTASMGLAVQDGRIIAIDPKIDGLLGQVISANTLAKSFEEQINSQLAAQGRRVTNVRIEQGALVVTISS
jgi:hypothetical protein